MDEVASQSAPGRAVAQRPLHVFFVATEASGDHLGAALIGALRDELGSRLVLSGIGGPAMEAAGMRSLFPVAELAITGFSDIPQRLWTIVRRIRETARAVVAAQPDVLVIIDSPDFTHRVARRVRRAAPSIPIVDYVSPSVWAWRPGRARSMRAYVDHILALLPFEPAAHARLNGPACTYVGHPLVEHQSDFRADPAEARRRDADPPVILVLPGSRAGEAGRLIAPFGDALEQVGRQVGRVELVLPTMPQLRAAMESATAQWPMRPRILDDAADKRAAFRVARAALAASGTVTLELALAGVPTVAAYRVPPLEAVVLRRMIRVPTVILANLVIGENVVPEFLQEDCTPDRLAAALIPLIGDTPERRRQVEAFQRLDVIMGIGTTMPSRRAAEIVLDYARRGPRTAP